MEVPVSVLITRAEDRIDNAVRESLGNLSTDLVCYALKSVLLKYEQEKSEMLASKAVEAILECNDAKKKLKEVEKEEPEEKTGE